MGAWAALFFYEYFISLSGEVKYLASRPTTSGLVLFLVNRYTTLITRVARLIQFVDWSGVSEPVADKVSIKSHR